MDRSDAWVPAPYTMSRTTLFRIKPLKRHRYGLAVAAGSGHPFLYFVRILFILNHDVEEHPVQLSSGPVSLVESVNAQVAICSITIIILYIWPSLLFYINCILLSPLMTV